MTEIDDTPMENDNFEEFNSDDDGLGLYDAFEDDILEPELAGNRVPGRSGHKLMILAGILGAVIIIVLIGLVIYSGMMQPQQTTSHTQVAAEVHAQNTVTSMVATALSATKTAIAEKVIIKKSEVSPTQRMKVEDAAVMPKEVSTSTAVVAPTNTPLPAKTETTSSAKSLEGDQSAAHTATVAALLTLSADGEQTSSSLMATGPVIKSEAMTSTAVVDVSSDVSVASLPDSGVIDNIGLAGMLGGAIILLCVIMLARRLRKR